MEALIRVRWAEATEFVPLSTARPVGPTSTDEMWDDGSYVTYNVKSKLTKLASGLTQLRINYLSAANGHLSAEEIPWGYSLITFAKGAREGQALWFDEGTAGQRPGKSRWKVSSDADQRKLERIAATRIKREATLRADLVRHGCTCAITGEPAFVCDAAHLVSVANRGWDEPRNAILLRADLHRLFDADLFDIDAEGKVCDIHSSLSAEYVWILDGKELSARELGRTRRALHMRASQRRGRMR